jgi:hypothetical protein
MFNVNPKILCHASALQKGNFVSSEFIINKSDSASQTINLFRRQCPHRMYPIGQPGENIQEITCKFHNFQWTRDGVPVNNSKKIKCAETSISPSGLVFLDFNEPDTYWSQCLKNESNLEYSHSVTGSSEQGSWLWLMDAEADLLHVYLDGIHPFLAKQVDIKNVQLEQGDGWILQVHPSGWWLYIFPYIFVEYTPGCVMVNCVTPRNPDLEHGYDWICQFYYDPKTSVDKRFVFETLVEVFKQDIEATEKQKVPYFPLMKATNTYEDHCVHFGKWFMQHKKK